MQHLDEKKTTRLDDIPEGQEPKVDPQVKEQLCISKLNPKYSIDKAYFRNIVTAVRDDADADISNRKWHNLIKSVINTIASIALGILITNLEFWGSELQTVKVISPLVFVILGWSGLFWYDLFLSPKINRKKTTVNTDEIFKEMQDEHILTYK